MAICCAEKRLTTYNICLENAKRSSTEHIEKELCKCGPNLSELSGAPLPGQFSISPGTRIHNDNTKNGEPKCLYARAIVIILQLPERVSIPFVKDHLYWLWNVRMGTVPIIPLRIKSQNHLPMKFVWMINGKQFQSILVGLSQKWYVLENEATKFKWAIDGVSKALDKIIFI